MAATLLTTTVGVCMPDLAQLHSCCHCCKLAAPSKCSTSGVQLEVQVGPGPRPAGNRHSRYLAFS